jgi:hypothetical protein
MDARILGYGHPLFNLFNAGVTGKNLALPDVFRP